MRMKVLQAMALGKAVVTTTRGAEGLAIADQHAPVVTADDSVGFAQAIGRLLSDDGLRRELGKQARRYVETNFSSQAYASRIEAIYAEMQGEQR
jgi:glycosyltransferase involved in cell wall biosynthesis